MKRIGLFAAAILALVAFTGSGAFAQGTTSTNQLTIPMNEQNGSGQSGTATLTEANGQLMVTINLSGGTSSPQPAHIHRGTCANLDPKPAIPLTNVVNGTSSTTIDLTTNTVAKSLSDLLNGQFAVNVHKSAAEVSVYVACGDIVNNTVVGGTGTTGTGTGTTGTGGTGTTTPGMPTTGNADQTPLLALLALLALGTVSTGLVLARRKV